MKHRLFLDGEAYDVWLARQGSGHVLLLDDAEHRLVPVSDAIVVVDGDDVHLHIDGRAFHVRYEHPLDRFANEDAANAEDIARAPMPGVVVTLQAKPGDVVASGDMLMVIESMKLETGIKAARDGIVEAIHFAIGQSFERDAILVTLAAPEN